MTTGWAGVVSGPSARTQFEGYRDSDGDAYVSFESMPGGPVAPFTANGVDVTIRTTQVRYPSIVNVDYPVSVCPYGFVTSTNNGTKELMGTASPSGSPDGQSRYEIRLSVPQLRAGVQRDWNVYCVTRFYNATGTLLGEHQNTANREFVGYVADTADDAARVARIELDGVNAAGGYQVGFTYDLFFGGEPVVPPAGTLVYGPSARALFETLAAQAGDTRFDFNTVPAGPMAPLTAGGVTVTARTTLQRYPSVVTVDYPVSVIPFDFVTTTPSGTRELTGTRSASGLPDGQSRYEIRLSVPQRRAGVQRNWNTNSLTRFYNAAGTLLAEHQNTTGREFVGYLAANDEEGSRVARIECDGLLAGGGYQVGNTDDLFYGSAAIPDSVPTLWAVGVSISPDAGGSVTVVWGPAVGQAWIEFSTDLLTWQKLAGPVAGSQWTGPIPAGAETRGYLRVTTQDPS